MYFPDTEKWMWKYFVRTEAKEMAECVHCSLYFRCMRTADLYRHIMDCHWDKLDQLESIRRSDINSERTWILKQFDHYVHVAICKICDITVSFETNHALAAHLCEHNIKKNTKFEKLKLKPRSNIIKIEQPREKIDTSYNSYLIDVENVSKTIKCYESCILHNGKKKLPFKISLVKKLEKLEFD